MCGVLRMRNAPYDTADCRARIKPIKHESNQYNPDAIALDRGNRYLTGNGRGRGLSPRSPHALQLLQLPTKEIPLSMRTAPSPRTGSIRPIGLIRLRMTGFIAP